MTRPLPPELAALGTVEAAALLGALLAVLRRRWGRRQVEVARSLGISQPSVQRMEAGLSTITVEGLEAIAAVLEVPAHRILRLHVILVEGAQGAGVRVIRRPFRGVGADLVLHDLADLVRVVDSWLDPSVGPPDARLVHPLFDSTRAGKGPSRRPRLAPTVAELTAVLDDATRPGSRVLAVVPLGADVPTIAARVAARMSQGRRILVTEHGSALARMAATLATTPTPTTWAQGRATEPWPAVSVLLLTVQAFVVGTRAGQFREGDQVLLLEASRVETALVRPMFPHLRRVGLIGFHVGDHGETPHSPTNGVIDVFGGAAVGLSKEGAESEGVAPVIRWRWIKDPVDPCLAGVLNSRSAGPVAIICADPSHAMRTVAELRDRCPGITVLQPGDLIVRDGEVRPEHVVCFSGVPRDPWKFARFGVIVFFGGDPRSVQGQAAMGLALGAGLDEVEAVVFGEDGAVPRAGGPPP